MTATGQNKTYDGTTDATVTLSDNRVSGDTLSASYTGAGFVDKNVGTGKTLTPTGSVNDGNGGANYTVTFSSVNTGTIASRSITVPTASWVTASALWPACA